MGWTSTTTLHVLKKLRSMICIVHTFFISFDKDKRQIVQGVRKQWSKCGVNICES